MAGRTGVSRHYIGKSGQLAAMSEFLWRGWNVAIPEVDEGDDIFVVQHTSGDLFRIQVKTGTAKEKRNPLGYEVYFSLATRQISEPRTPELRFVFCFRLPSNQWRFALATATELNDLRAAGKLGRETKKGYLLFRLRLTRKGNRRDGLIIRIPRQRDENVSKFLNAWQNWPVIIGS